MVDVTKVYVPDSTTGKLVEQNLYSLDAYYIQEYDYRFSPEDISSEERNYVEHQADHTFKEMFWKELNKHNLLLRNKTQTGYKVRYTCKLNVMLDASQADDLLAHIEYEKTKSVVKVAKSIIEQIKTHKDFGGPTSGIVNYVLGEIIKNIEANYISQILENMVSTLGMKEFLLGTYFQEK